jgi:Tubulin/FtsZ family, GTPase domain
LVSFGLGGGSGSGLGYNMLSELKDFGYDKMSVTQCLYPNSNVSDNILETYNATLIHDSLVCASEMTFMLDNHSLTQFAKNNYSLHSVTTTDLNQIISDFNLLTTASMRFRSAPSSYDFRKIATSIVPFPRMHFMSPSMAGFKLSGTGYESETMVQELFDKNGSLIDILRS